MFDVHTHIINNSYPHILDVGIAEELTNKSKYFSTGLHPKLFDQETIITDFQTVEKLCQLDNCIAIGECGLDITANNNYQTQKIVFEKQIK